MPLQPLLKDTPVLEDFPATYRRLRTTTGDSAKRESHVVEEAPKVVNHHACALGYDSNAYKHAGPYKTGVGVPGCHIFPTPISELKTAAHERIHNHQAGRLMIGAPIVGACVHLPYQIFPYDTYDPFRSSR